MYFFLKKRKLKLLLNKYLFNNLEIDRKKEILSENRLIAVGFGFKKPGVSSPGLFFIYTTTIICIFTLYIINDKGKLTIISSCRIISTC